MRVTVVGSGFVGATAAMRVVQKGLADEVVMIDIVEGLPQGLALDMKESAPIEAFEPHAAAGIVRRERRAASCRARVHVRAVRGRRLELRAAADPG